MMHPHLREVVRRVELGMAVEVHPCGGVSPERAFDMEPVRDEWERMHGMVEGVALGLGTPLQHGVTARHFTDHRPCTHPGHYEMDG